MTRAFNLPARFVIHAVGPIWKGGRSNEAELLRSAYSAAFEIAKADESIRSIAFPAISTGIFSYPKERAAGIAVEAMKEHESDFDRIIACLFDDETLGLYRTLM